MFWSESTHKYGVVSLDPIWSIVYIFSIFRLFVLYSVIYIIVSMRVNINSLGLGQCFQPKKLLSLKTSIYSFESSSCNAKEKYANKPNRFCCFEEIGKSVNVKWTKKNDILHATDILETAFWALVCIICWNVFFFRFNFQCKVPKRKQECFQQLKSQINGHEWIININPLSLQICDICFCKLIFASF